MNRGSFIQKSAFLLLAVFCLFMQFAAADTVTLTLMNVGPGSAGGPNSSGGVYVYPYYFSINGSLSFTPLICDSYDNEVTISESWSATVSPLNQFTGMMSPTVASGLTKQQAYEEAAFLLSRLDGDTSAADAAGVNYAIWSLFASDVPSSAYNNAGAATWRSLADNAIQTLPSSFYDNFVVYTPISGSQPNGAALPQEYIGEITNTHPQVPPAVPEPSSLILMFSGGMGVLGTIRKKLA